MRKLLIGALALAFAASAPALADNHRGHGGGGSRPAMHTGSHASSRAHLSNRRPAMAHRSVRGSTHRSVRPTGRHGTAHRVVRHTTRRTVHRPSHHVVRHTTKRRTVVHKSTAKRFAHARRAVHARHRYHVGAYRRPHGWYRHHWAIGNRLPRGWFARDYWITDWAIYGLWAPIDGLVWVRVGPDAMLIDPVTGEVVGVEYGIFW
jgi:Ni/Co efflux regulator RcnB